MVRGILNKVVEIGKGLGRFVRRLWEEHQELLDSNPVYRHQLEAGVVALLGACSLHPTAALIATVAIAVFIAAHESGNSAPWRPAYGGPTIRRPGDSEWDY